MLAGLAAVAAAAGVVRAGPLNPPAGPVMSTAKPLAEIEPRIAVNTANTPGAGSTLFNITQPGSYYLTGNIDVPDGRTAISITASGVRLDLGGFRIAAIGALAALGITNFGSAVTGIEIRNGSIVGMGDGGISLSNVDGVVVEDIVVLAASNVGIRVGAGARLTRVVCLGCAQDGIVTGTGGAVLDCTARGNGMNGIRVGFESLVEACICGSNTLAGIQTVGTACVVRACIATGNGTHGIVAGSVVAACAATGNTQRGISAESASVVGCAARANGASGIYAQNSEIDECAAVLGVSAGLTAHGFELNHRSSLTNSVAYNNQGVGVAAGQGCRVEGCAVRRQSLDGILALALAGRSLILHNAITGNGLSGPNSAGLRLASIGCRAEGNLLAFGSGFGVWITAPGNLIIGNACSGNLINWNIASTNNVYGPIVDRTVPGSPGVLGSGTAASTMGTVDPHANFSL